MPPDTTPGLGHPDAAGWALGALDPADAEAFEAHLPDCARCQVTVAEFEAVTRALTSAAPAVEPPPDLGARTLASVQHAIMTAGQPGQAETLQPAVMMAVPAREAPTAATVQEATSTENKPSPGPARMSRWWHWHWNFPVLLAAACGAAAAAIVMVVVQQIGQAAPVASFSLTPVASNAAGTVIVHRITNGWTLDASLRRLPALKGNEYYECWYVPSADAQPSNAITAGSFIPGRSSGTFPMTSAADPHHYKIMEIAIQHPGDSGRPGTVILRGSAQPS